jgi:hypothetical protein
MVEQTRKDEEETRDDGLSTRQTETAQVTRQVIVTQWRGDYVLSAVDSCFSTWLAELVQSFYHGLRYPRCAICPHLEQRQIPNSLFRVSKLPNKNRGLGLEPNYLIPKKKKKVFLFYICKSRCFSTKSSLIYQFAALRGRRGEKIAYE